jgi:hypothetical protein
MGVDYARGDGGTGGAREGAGVDARRGYNLLSTGTMVEMLGMGMVCVMYVERMVCKARCKEFLVSIETSRSKLKC